MPFSFGSKRDGLCVSSSYSLEKNLEIIKIHFKECPQLTAMQVNYLSRFKWVGHKKGLNFPECKCLRCAGLNALKEIRKREVLGNLYEASQLLKQLEGNQ